MLRECSCTASSGICRKVYNEAHRADGVGDMITEEEWRELNRKIDYIKAQVADKGHLLIIIMLLMILMDHC